LRLGSCVLNYLDGGIGENSLRQAKDLEVPLLDRIERLGHEPALIGTENDY
jgi:hypothetical protein